MSNGTTTPAAWYSDPADASKLRWWDGSAWTAQVAARPAVIPNPPAPPQAAYAAQTAAVPQLPVRQGWTPATLSTHTTKRSSQTVSSWFLATAVVWVFVPGEFIAAFVATGFPAAAPLANLVVIVAMQFWLAWLDGNRLDAQGYVRTSIAWTLLPTPVYFIIRAMRVGAGGVAVLVVNLACVALTFTFAVAIVVKALDATGL